MHDPRRDHRVRPRPAPRARQPDSERTCRRPGRLVPVRLREHDLQLRGRVVRDGPVARRGHPVREGQRAVRVQRRDRGQRRDQRHRLADPRRAERPRRRSAAAVPALLHCSASSRRRSSARARRSSASFSSRSRTRLSVGADLLRRDAEDRQLPGDAGQAGDRGGGGLLRDDRDRRPDLRARPADRERVLRRGRAVRAVRDPAVPRRPRPDAATWHAGAGPARRDRRARAASGDDPRRPDGAGPARFLVGRSSTPTRSTSSS